MPLILLIFGHVAISALTHVLVRGVLRDEGVPPEIVVAARATVASLVMLPLGRFAGGSFGKLDRRDRLRLLVVAALAVPVNQLCYVAGLAHTQATHGALLFCLTPLLVGALAPLFGGARTSRRAFAGVALAVLGVAVIFGRSLANSSGKDGAELILGDSILMGAVAAWSLVTLLSRSLLAKIPSFALSRALLLCGAPMLLPFVLAPSLRFDWATLSARAIGVIVFLGAGTSVAAYVLWNVLLRRLGPVRCAVLVTLQPVAVGLMAWPMLGEPVTPELFLGGTLVILGVLMAQRAAAVPAPAVAVEP